MGDQKSAINGRNDFYSYIYTTLSPRVTINGVTGKMIADKSGIDSEHPHLPAYANTCDIYFYPDKDKVAVQAKLYGSDKKMLQDFDWNHTHKNKDKYGNITEIFPKGIVHVQEYSVTKRKDNKTGKWKDHFKRKSNKARLMTSEEIKKYGPILLKFNPTLKFRP